MMHHRSYNSLAKLAALVLMCDDENVNNDTLEFTANDHNIIEVKQNQSLYLVLHKTENYKFDLYYSEQFDGDYTTQHYNGHIFYIYTVT